MIFYIKSYHFMKHQQFLIKTNETENEEATSYFQMTIYVMFTKMIEKWVIKNLGEVAMEEMTKEFKQIDEVVLPIKNMIIPMEPDLLT